MLPLQGQVLHGQVEGGALLGGGEALPAGDEVGAADGLRGGLGRSLGLLGGLLIQHSALELGSGEFGGGLYRGGIGVDPGEGSSEILPILLPGHGNKPARLAPGLLQPLALHPADRPLGPQGRGTLRAAPR